MTLRLLRDFLKYFQTFDRDVVDMQELMFMVGKVKGTFKSPEEAATYKRMAYAAVPDVDEGTFNGITKVLHDANYADTMAKLLTSYSNGDEVDIVTHAQAALTTYKSATRANDNIGGYVDDDISDILRDQTDVSKGIRPRLSALRDYMRPLRAGDFGILAARPDQGKTSFICAELTYMATQTDRPILWFNNESMGKNIYPRLYQAALNLTYPELLELNRKGTLVKEYLKAIESDDPFKIRIKDIHDFTIGQVERVIEEIQPSIVVYDMIDNIKGFGAMARTDLALEEMYKYCRTLAVTHNHIGIATSQISADGDQLCFPTQGMLKDSKTGKQGACDFILMMGQNNDAGPNQRFIGLPKNKLMLAGKRKDPQQEVIFDASRCRFNDLKVISI